MKAKNNFTSTLNTISCIQLILLTITGIIYFFCKELEISSALIISGITFFLYTQLVRLSSKGKMLFFLGFPIRVFIVAAICAILVHKFHSNLIALFIGFVVSLTVYFICIWGYLIKNNQETTN